MCDIAIRQDNPHMLKECMDRGFIDADSEVLGFPNVLVFCEARGYTRCAELLRNSKGDRSA